MEIWQKAKTVNKKDLLKIKKEYLIIAAVIGVALMMVAKVGDLEETTSGENESSSLENAINFGISNESDISETDYAAYTTEKIKNCLESMEGVGKVEVFITVESSNDSYMGDNTLKVQGVMVVAEGAENPIVVQDITEACEALFSLDAHKIKVVRMKEEIQ